MVNVDVLKILVIGCGGFVGAILRYLVSGLIQNLSNGIIFPYGTLGVNVIGCFVIGLLTRLVETHSVLSTEMRFFLLIGLLGSFTTFSTFGNETFGLMRDKELHLALINIFGSVLLGLIAVWAGRMTTYVVWR